MSAFSSQEATKRWYHQLSVFVSRLRGDRATCCGVDRALCRADDNHTERMRRTTRFTDWTLLIIVVAAIALIVLAILFFWRPVATGNLTVRWWRTVTMALLFFGVVALGYHRRRARSHAALHRALAETREELAEGADAEETGTITPPSSREGTGGNPEVRFGRKKGESERTKAD